MKTQANRRLKLRILQIVSARPSLSTSPEVGPNLEPLGSPLPSEFSTDHEITQRERALVTRAPPHSPRPFGSPVRHRQSADGPAHRARERTRGSLPHAIPTLLPMLREWYRVSRSRWPQREFPSAPLAASSASRFRSPARMFPMSWFPSWQAYSYRRWSLRAMGMDTVQGFVQTVGSVIVHS